jgi:hypothetical protein
MNPYTGSLIIFLKAISLDLLKTPATAAKINFGRGIIYICNSSNYLKPYPFPQRRPKKS